MAALPGKTRTANDVIVYIPNLIGYARVIFTLVSFLLMTCAPTFWVVSLCLYLVSFIGDLFDGMMARKFDQTSGFGGVLDMITDRCSTLGFLFVLAGDYAEIDAGIGFPFYRITFLFLVLLDVSSHWVQMHSTLATGQHHKSESGNEGRHFLVRWFYKYYFFFGYLCVGAELTYILLFAKRNLLLGGASVSMVATCNYLLALTVPGCIMKQFVNVSQLSSAFWSIAKQDAELYNRKKSLK